MPRPGLLDTSVFIAREDGRPLDVDALPAESAVSVVTIAELQVGVLSAPDTEVRARRMATLATASQVTPLPITVEAARAWATLRVRLAEEGRRANVNDLWIAAIALAEGLDVVTHDSDYDVIASVGGPGIVRV
ncbi:type II toxin-antitoxin system VapC family toxin [Miniimonas arenae]|uniref:Ribonuclease VapC n=1 Tax=Miniimonas arenae TaxID=676201 RepID=A0A5C5BA20_9MICO|nr:MULTISPECIES: type II toxin-antitoxin system VapC family toxin [Miniimonas]TNU73369.1 type II toxin-antitoxin system VapC family toxin [Miniimonas arenae]